MSAEIIRNTLILATAAGLACVATILAVRWMFGQSVILKLWISICILVFVVAVAAFMIGQVGISITSVGLGVSAGILTCTSVAWAIYSQIIAPLRKLSGIVQKISQGNLSETPGYQAQDEVGRLAMAMAEMTVYLRDAADLAGKIAQGDLTGGMVLRSEQDVFGQAINYMSTTLRSSGAAWAQRSGAK